MKKFLAILVATLMVFSVISFASAADYTIRIYSNSNSTERVNWLIDAAKAAGFTISLDDNSVYSGDDKAVGAANENKDGDLIFGLNEVRWSQLVNGQYENLTVMDWTPSWADKVGDYKFDGKAYGLVIQNILMLYRTDEFGTNGEKLHFAHWADLGGNNGCSERRGPPCPRGHGSDRRGPGRTDGACGSAPPGGWADP